MGSAFLKALVFACGLTLALPHGWCCMADAWASPPQPAAAATGVRSCCGHCTGPARPEAPPHRPALLPPGKCPCDGREGTVLHVVKAVDGDLAPAALPPAIDLVPVRIEANGTVLRPVFPADLSLHLLHRVWLC